MSKIQIRKENITAMAPGSGRVIAEWSYWEVRAPDGSVPFDTHAEAIDFADMLIRNVQS